MCSLLPMGLGLWYVNAETGETIDSYSCMQTTTVDGEEEFTGYLAALGTGCMVGFHTNDAMYIVDEGNFLHPFQHIRRKPWAHGDAGQVATSQLDLMPT